MRSYRILLTLSFRKWAGDPRAVLELSKGLTERGHRVLVATPEDGVLGRNLLAAGLPVRHFEYRNGWSVRTARALAALVREEGIELIDTHSSHDRKAAILARWVFRAPARLVVTRRAVSASFPLQNTLYAAAADRVVAISRGVAESLIRGGMPRDKVSVVHTGIDPARLTEAVDAAELERLRRELGLDPALPTVGMVGRRKDQETLLRAAARLGRPLNVLLVGIGRDDSLRALEGDLPAGSRVAYTGYQPRVQPYYRLLDVKVLATRGEGLSQAILESMALGVPVVSAAVGGTPEVVSHGRSGLLFPPGDDQALAGELERLLDDGALRQRLVEGGQETVQGPFHVASLIRGTEAVYRELLEGR